MGSNNQHGLNLGLSVTERGRNGVSIGYQHMSGGTDSKANGLGLKVGYSWDQNGQNGGLNASATYTAQGNWSPFGAGAITSMTSGLTYDYKNGYGVTFSTQGQNGVFDNTGNISWSQNGGFNSSYEMTLNYDRLLLEGLTQAQKQKIADEAKLKNPTMLSDLEKAALREEAEAKAAEARAKETSNVLLALGYVFGIGKDTLLGDLFGIGVPDPNVSYMLLGAGDDAFSDNFPIGTRAETDQGKIRIKTERGWVDESEVNNPYLHMANYDRPYELILDRINAKMKLEGTLDKQMKDKNSLFYKVTLNDEMQLVDSNGKLLKDSNPDVLNRMYAELGEKLGDRFNPDLVKLEIINNFKEVKDAKGNVTSRTTSVNGVAFDLATSGSLGNNTTIDKILQSAGDSWMMLAKAAIAQNVERIGINTVIYSGYHESGTSIDVGSISVRDSQTQQLTRIDFRYNQGQTIPLSAANFIDALMNQSGSLNAWHPWEMVYQGGNFTLANKFWEAGSEFFSREWNQLTEAQKIKVRAAIPDAYQNNAESMWKHRHHLHFEVGPIYAPGLYTPITPGPRKDINGVLI